MSRKVVIIITSILCILIIEPALVSSRRSRGRTRGKTQLDNSRLPTEAKWRDPSAVEYYEHPGGAKITKASHFDMEYSLGHKVYFMCIATGNPRPEIIWYKDGIELYAHNHLMIHEWRVGENKLKSKMEIDPATQRDQGLYECSAHNRYSFDKRMFRTDIDLD